MQSFTNFFNEEISPKTMSIIAGKNNGRTLVDRNEKFYVQQYASGTGTINVFWIENDGNAHETILQQSDVLFYGPHLNEVYLHMKNGQLYKDFMDEQRIK